MTMESIPVRFAPAAAHCYQVIVGVGVLSEIASHVDLTPYSKIIIISDHTIAPLWLAELKKGLRRECGDILVTPGEGAKNLLTLGTLLTELQKIGADRSSLICNLGGGVITDLGGFAASSYMRGVDCVHIPTTLLSQVDASVGGKTGIDHAGIKNLVGSFAQPRAVIIDPTTLTTLSDREYASGFAEIIKHGVISSSTYFKAVSIKKPREFTRDELTTIIADSVRIKAQIVSSDEKESGPRKLLNFGHTAGHALEAYFLQSKSPLLHGEAISLGMIAEAKMSVLAGMLKVAELIQIEEALAQAALPTRLTELPSYEVLYTLMLGDKKTRASKLKWVLPVNIGEAKYDCELSADIVKAGLEYLKS